MGCRLLLTLWFSLYCSLIVFLVFLSMGLVQPPVSSGKAGSCEVDSMEKKEGNNENISPCRIFNLSCLLGSLPRDLSPSIVNPNTLYIRANLSLDFLSDRRHFLNPVCVKNHVYISVTVLF